MSFHGKKEVVTTGHLEDATPPDPAIAARTHHSDQHAGLIARLYEACVSCSRDLVSQSNDCRDKIDQAGSKKALERVYHTLSLWGDGFAVGDGALDEKLELSARIRSQVLFLLQSIGATLSTRRPSRVLR